MNIGGQLHPKDCRTLSSRIQNEREKYKDECIPVGCVRPAVLDWGGGGAKDHTSLGPHIPCGQTDYV